MKNPSRRDFILKSAGSLISTSLLLPQSYAYAQEKLTTEESSLSTEILRERWLSSATSFRDVKGNLVFSRFVEPIYFLIQPIGWSPNKRDAGRHRAVHVPIGFVTDLASVPRAFWSILPRDGEYTYAAIIHDYLYWEQSVSRADADDILRLAMEDLQVNSATVATIYAGVRVGGTAAWDNNVRLKEQGEKRVLRLFPENPTTRWADWKQRTDVFV